MLHATLLALNALERQLASAMYHQADHHTPTRHESTDTFMLMPHRRGAPLPSLRKTIVETRASATVVILPLFLQLDPMIFWTHREHHIPHAAAAPHQPLVAVELIRQLKPQLVIGTPHTARRVETALAEANVDAPFSWHLICDPRHFELLATSRLVYYDLHTIPGRSVAHQCSHLALKKQSQFHLSCEHTWRENSGVLYATDIDQTLPAPLTDFAALTGHITHEPCPCGDGRTCTLQS
ncbi:MAG: hypothetical protein KBE09_02185 [Candidatus Pacebacteria bacterium]|nr:hypothetical protein [Candidatus Paceibacterota bacterium]